MNRRKSVELEFTGAEAIVLEKGTEPVKNLPDVFEISIQGEEGFRCSVHLVRTPVIDQFKADITVRYPEDIKQWR